MRAIFLCCGAVAALVAGPAFAQTAPSPAPGSQGAKDPAKAASDASGQSSRPGAAKSDEIGEIVITAERRSSTLQHTPATVSVLTGSEMRSRGIGTINDALNTVAGVYVQENNKGVNIDIRGVGTSLDSAAGDPGVNTNIDGVYIRQASAVVSGLYDLNRIEVLKGPQGTLYGRNATGGVVNILTADPTQDFDYHGSITGGNYSLIRTEGALNVPLSDDLALRAAFGSESHDGYYNSGQDDADRIAARVKLRWAPSTDFRILVGASYSHDGGVGSGSILVTEPEGSRNADTAPPVGQLNQKFITAFSTVEWDAGPVRLTFIPTWSNYIYDSIGTAYGFYSQQRVREKQATSELRLSSPTSSPIQWVGGLYYYDDKLSNYANLLNQGIVNLQPHLNTRSYAAFADATLPVTSSLRLIGGIRYTKDHKTQRDTTVVGGGVTVGPFNGVLNSHALNFRAGVQYDLTPRAMLYATYSTGYKAGGFLPDEPGYNTFKPEHLRAAEAGIKTRLIDNHLQLNLSGFYYNYDNYQVSALGIAHYGGLSALVFNAQGRTKIFGAEVQLTYRPTPDDQFELNASPLHSRFGQFVIPASPITPPVDITGKQLPSAPSLSGNVAYEHSWRFANASRVTGRVDSYYSSAYWSEFSHAPYSRRPHYTRTDLSLTYFAPGDRWSIGAWVRNLENSWIVSLKANTFIGDYALQPPRTFGLTLSVRR
jgi:iron complex outermembrane receptor protein